MHTMHLLPGVAIQPNLELKTRPKQLLGSLPLVIALPDGFHQRSVCWLMAHFWLNVLGKIVQNILDTFAGKQLSQAAVDI